MHQLLHLWQNKTAQKVVAIGHQSVAMHMSRQAFASKIVAFTKIARDIMRG
jgi:hypothetical protein